jgi:hypothetical protein
MATGNNLQFDSDISRRTVWIRIDSRVDRPWERNNFRKDNLIVWVRRHRHELVWACLVLVQHWLAVGRPAWGGKALGSYESWSNVVGGILDAAGIQGFLANREELYSRADAETEEWRSFTGRWLAVHGEAAVKAVELLELAQDFVPSVFERVKDGASQRALLTRLGRALSAKRDRSFAGVFIKHAGEDKHDGGALWRLDCGTSTGPDTSTSAEVPHERESIPDTNAELAEQAEPVWGVDPTFQLEDESCTETARRAKQVPQVPLVPQTDSKRIQIGADVGRNFEHERAEVPPCRRCGRSRELASSNLCDACRVDAVRALMQGQV